ncbi:hypothetical protein [Cognatilysobacter lacus]|uniref:Tetratricopeptide repeat protein n=1 Tax=Cognatilysobacter lacus TaxID=1643323 RepID=A0A5D8Z894_9GAMM|nr:hypothetical protein [Lysobacter lacus]TZF90860.1 hypothetical protein FW784_03650 [Lysobacter lacus]
MKRVSVAKRPRFFLLGCLASALFAMLLLSPGLGGGFLFDDQASIINNQVVHLVRLDTASLSHAAYSYQPGNGSRPLSMLTFALDYWWGGLNPLPYKITNLIIHGLTTCALALLFRSLLAAAHFPPRQCAIGAVLLAAIWSIHPLQVSSVLYVVQRMQTLCTLFMVLALLNYVRMRVALRESRPFRLNLLLICLSWALAFASKEDAVLLPAYTFLLELTLLRFQASSVSVSRWLRLGYTAFVVLGCSAYLVFLAHDWQWAHYPGRDFSTSERLLTQARVLVMYIGEIVFPLPARLKFFYDDFAISRGLFEPWTTAASVLTIGSLIALAWRLRATRPLMAFGILFFFAGHFVTSNAVNLEMAFEHRNHLPMIGIVLALGDLCVALHLYQSALARRVGIITFALLATACSVRAYAWGEPLRFAKETLVHAPTSERAWMLLDAEYAERSGMNPGPYLDLAIATSSRGATVTSSPPLLANVVIYKTIRGDVTPQDWNRLFANLERATMGVQNHNVVWIIVNDAKRKVPLDESSVIETIEIIVERSEFTANEYLQLAAYIYNDTTQPGRALPLLRRAVLAAEPDDPDISSMFRDLPSVGRADWAAELKSVMIGRSPRSGSGVDAQTRTPADPRPLPR